MGEDSWEKMERFRKALGWSSFVDVRPSRWRYAIHWLRLNNIVSLVLGRCSQNRCASPPHGHGEIVPTGGPKRLHPSHKEDLRGDWAPDLFLRSTHILWGPGHSTSHALSNQLVPFDGQVYQVPWEDSSLYDPLFSTTNVFGGQDNAGFHALHSWHEHS